MLLLAALAFFGRLTGEDSFIMIVYGNCQGFFCKILTDDVFIEFFFDACGLGKSCQCEGVAIGEVFLLVILAFDDLIANIDAIFADHNACGRGNEKFYVIFRSAAKRAACDMISSVAVIVVICHTSYPFWVL